MNPSSTPMMEILTFGMHFSELSDEVNTFCQTYFDEYIKNRDQWAKQDGHRLRVDAARLACLNLRSLARRQKNADLEAFYTVEENKCINEMIQMVQERRW
jgi:hypothetical protein